MKVIELVLDSKAYGWSPAELHFQHITAYEDDSHERADAELLDRATTLERILFTRDDDLLAEATRRQRAGIPFRGIVYAHQLRVSIGTCIEELEIIARDGEPDDLMNRIQFLPL